MTVEIRGKNLSSFGNPIEHLWRPQLYIYIPYSLIVFSSGPQLQSTVVYVCFSCLRGTQKKNLANCFENLNTTTSFTSLLARFLYSENYIDGVSLTNDAVNENGFYLRDGIMRNFSAFSVRRRPYNSKLKYHRYCEPLSPLLRFFQSEGP